MYQPRRKSKGSWPNLENTFLSAHPSNVSPLIWRGNIFGLLIITLKSSSIGWILCDAIYLGLRIWGKDHNKLDDLARGVENLNKVRNTAVRHRLALLAWSTFFAKPAKDSINMTGDDLLIS